MAITQIVPSDFQSEYPTLSVETIQRYIDEVIGLATVYNAAFESPSYTPTTGVLAVLRRAIRGQLAAARDSAQGPQIQSATANGFSIRLDKDGGSSLFGDVFTADQIAILRGGQAAPQQTIGSMTVW